MESLRETLCSAQGANRFRNHPADRKKGTKRPISQRHTFEMGMPQSLCAGTSSATVTARWLLSGSGMRPPVSRPPGPCTSRHSLWMPAPPPAGEGARVPLKPVNSHVSRTCNWIPMAWQGQSAHDASSGQNHLMAGTLNHNRPQRKPWTLHFDQLQARLAPHPWHPLSPG